MKTSVIITAGGYGKRMGLPSGKQFIEIAGKSMLEWTISVFLQVKAIDEIIVVVNEEDFPRLGRFRGIRLVVAGSRRQDSVNNGLKEVSEDADIVVIHDGARPLVTPEMIEASISAAQKDGACVVAVPVKDTIKKVSPLGFVVNTEDRSLLWSIQTPQAFKYSVIKEAFGKFRKELATDDASLVEKLGHPVKIVEGSYENIKVTTPDDVMIAEQIFKGRKQ